MYYGLPREMEMQQKKVPDGKRSFQDQKKSVNWIGKYARYVNKDGGKLMYAERIEGLKSSAIRDILKLTTRKGMISFAGGLPAPELFPLNDIESATHKVLSRYGSNALQYSITEGISPLREKIAAMLDPAGRRVKPRHVIITQGSQQGLELLSKLFLDKGSIVFTENPSYLGALHAFRLFEADVHAIDMDDQGLIPNSLLKSLEKNRPAFIYLMPNFQNPTGVSLSLERRKELVVIAATHDLLIIEDDPYGELIFEGDKLPSLFTMAEGKNVIYLSSFSKTIAPGLRVAYAVGYEEIIAKMVIVKQGTDLQTNTLGQFIVNEYLESGNYAEHIATLRRTYASRRDIMLAAMHKYFPQSVRWNRPGGGMFLWITLPHGQDTRELLLRCIEHNVAFVPGQEFFPDSKGTNTARLNFSNASPDDIDEGIKRMSSVLRKVPV
jgi:2-aminoadipate transaminase